MPVGTGALLGAAAIAAGGSILGTAATNTASASLNQATRRWQTEENAKQRSFTEEMWNRNNAYNTPSAQRARFEEAGYNPYLVDSEVGSGESSNPASPAGVSATTPVAPQNYNAAFSHIGNMVDVLLKKKSVDADVANQRANTERTRIENASKLLNMGYSPSEVVQLMRATNPDYQADNYGSSNENRAVNSLISMQQARADLDSVQADIESRYGYEKAQQINWNLQQQASKTIVEIGLINKLDKLYDSQIEVNEHKKKLIDAQADEAIASAYNHFANADYVEKLGLTEDEKREYFVSVLQFEAAQKAMEFGSSFADYDELEGVREYKHTKSAKFNATWNYGLESNAATGTLDYIGNRAGNVLGTRQPAKALLKRRSVYSENGLTPRGYKAKRTVEDFEYE